MSNHTIERIRDVLSHIIDSYDNLKKLESTGGTKDQLRNELIILRDACDELPSLFIQTAKDANLDFNKILPLASIFKADFINGIRALIMTLSEPNFPSTEDWIKKQANLAVTMMNLNETINTYRMIYALLK